MNEPRESDEEFSAKQHMAYSRGFKTGRDRERARARARIERFISRILEPQQARMMQCFGPLTPSEMSVIRRGLQEMKRHALLEFEAFLFRPPGSQQQDKDS